MLMKGGECAFVYEGVGMCVFIKGGGCVCVHEGERVCVCS